jgi:probable HAF family extracellular repeat protein
MNARTFFAALLACAAWSVAQAAPPARWTLTIIPPIAAFGGDTALGINNRGEVVGSTTVLDPVQGTALHGFVWDNGTMIDLGRAPTGYPLSSARAINDRGTVLAGDGLGRQFTWDDGVWTPLPFQGQANTINRFGAIGGTYNTSLGAHGFVYRDGVFMDVGTLGGPYSEVAGVNDRGAAVGKSLTSGFQYHPYVYQDGVIKDLGTFGGSFGIATSINNRGEVVGTAHDSANMQQAFIYDGAAIRRLLPNVPESAATAINDHGAVIGWMHAAGTSWVYDDGVLTMLDQIPQVAAAGLHWLVPTAINDRGWITGYANRGTQTVAFLLVPK